MMKLNLRNLSWTFSVLVLLLNDMRVNRDRSKCGLPFFCQCNFVGLSLRMNDFVCLNELIRLLLVMY